MKECLRIRLELWFSGSMMLSVHTPRGVLNVTLRTVVSGSLTLLDSCVLYAWMILIPDNGFSRRMQDSARAVFVRSKISSLRDTKSRLWLLR